MPSATSPTTDDDDDDSGEVVEDDDDNPNSREGRRMPHWLRLFLEITTTTTDQVK
jgi:hypothetical protein